MFKLAFEATMGYIMAGVVFTAVLIGIAGVVGLVYLVYSKVVDIFRK